MPPQSIRIIALAKTVFVYCCVVYENTLGMNRYNTVLNIEGIITINSSELLSLPPPPLERGIQGLSPQILSCP